MVSWYNSCTVDWTLFFVFIKTGFIIFLVLNAYFLLSLKQTLTENKHAVFNARGQVHFPKGDFPSYNFPSGNFPKVSLAVIWGCIGGQTLRIGWFRWPIGAARTGWSRALRLGHTWKITNGKNLLGNYHVHLYNCTVLHLSVGGTKYCKINCLNAYYVHLYNCTVLQLSVEGTRYCTINCINAYYVHLYNCTVLKFVFGRDEGRDIVQSTVMDIMYTFIIVLYCSYLWEIRDVVQSIVMDIMQTFIFVLYFSYLWEGRDVVQSTVMDIAFSFIAAALLMCAGGK